MTRVASLYLPHWAIDRVRRAERRRVPPRPDTALDLAPLVASAAEEQVLQCDAPKNTGWRPGARWARSDAAAPAPSRAEVERQIADLPAHQRPPMREMGRRSEAADHPFRAMPPDEGARIVPTILPPRPDPEDAPARWGGFDGLDPNADDRAAAALARWNATPSVRSHGEGMRPDKYARAGSNDAGAAVAPFFNTGRSMSGAVARVCEPAVGPSASVRRVHSTTVRPEEPLSESEVASRRTDGSRRPFAKAQDLLTTNGEIPDTVTPPFVSSEVETPPVRIAGRDRSLDFARDERREGTRGGVRRIPSPAPLSPLPLVTVHKIGSRIEIAAACLAARALGLAPGMALTQARAAVPELDVRDADPAGDRADLERLAIALARRWCPVVAISDADGLFLDITGTAHLHGGEAALVGRLLRLLARLGIAAQIAIADTAGAAWALARQSEAALVVPPGGHYDALATLPVSALRLDEAALELLARLGVDTIGALHAMPRAPLVRRFGPAIVRRLDQATGAAPEPLDPVIPMQPITVIRRFAEPIATADAIGHWLAGLVEELTDALAKAGIGARALAFVAARVDSTDQVIRVGLARASRDPAHLLRLIARRIEEVDPGYGIDALALHLVRGDPLGPETLGAALAEQQAPDLAPLVDTLANRIGPSRLWRHQPVESDVPERSVAPLSPLDPPAAMAVRLKLDDVRRLDLRAPDHPWHPRWPRPTRLLRRPEPLDHVLAELPDQPPRRFTWRGSLHMIVHADGPERITGEWWRRPGERDAVRDYFRVEDDAGRRFWLFRRGDGLRAETGDLSWYVHGTFA